ncbi:MAG: hypothetical protein HY238_15160 [Acidobacteria bacterium]|nr:hypothetical protein [Acidobacteriota bacterium]
MALLVLTCLMDVERGVLLYRSYPTGDYHKHIFVTDAISRTGVPPVNPVFHPGRPLPLFYYFFWHLVCSMVDGLSGWHIGSRAAVEGMTAWATAGLFAVVLLLARRFLRPGTRRTVGICWALLFSTGLDLLGYLFSAFVEIEPGRITWRQGAVFLGAVDSWNWIGQVTSWLETSLWVPQHLAAAIVSMTGLLLVFGQPPSAEPVARRTRVFLFAAAAASSLGLSVWVTVVFCAFWPVWALVAWRHRYWEDLRFLLHAAVPAALLALPFAYLLFHARLDTRPPLAVGIRQFSLWHDYGAHIGSGLWQSMLELIWLVPAYFLEFGIFFLGGLFWWKHHRRPAQHHELALATLAAVSLGMTSVVRSNLMFNDFGWRGMLPAQFVLLLWTAWMLERLWRRGRRSPLVIGCLLLGFSTVGYDWACMRSYGIAMDVIHHNGLGGRHAWALKRLYERIAVVTPPSTIVQGNPNVWLEPHHSFSANRQSVVLDRVHGGLFGTQGPLFADTLQEVGAIFGRNPSPEQIERIARKYNIGVLVVQDSDAAWHSHVWDDRTRFRLLAQCDYARAYQIEFEKSRN